MSFLYSFSSLSAATYSPACPQHQLLSILEYNRCTWMYTQNSGVGLQDGRSVGSHAACRTVSKLEEVLLSVDDPERSISFKPPHIPSVEPPIVCTKLSHVLLVLLFSLCFFRCVTHFKRNHLATIRVKERPCLHRHSCKHLTTHTRKRLGYGLQ